MAQVQAGNEKIVGILNRIMEVELAGVVRYTHYSLLVFGYNRIPIVSWLLLKRLNLVTEELSTTLSTSRT